jgi:hypothetical protein
MRTPVSPEPVESTPMAFEIAEEKFFDDGERGSFEPPIVLPLDSFLIPFMGIALLAGLTVLVLS